MGSTLLNNSFRRNNNRKNFYATAIIVITMCCLFFVTSDIYSTYVQLSEESNMTLNKWNQLKSDLDKMTSKKQKVASDKSMQNLIKQFASEYREDLIINQIYKQFLWVTIDSISMDKWQKLPNWLSIANISISVSVKDVDKLKSYLDYLTWESSDIRFVIKSISFPLDTNNLKNNTQASLSLGMYYYSAQ